MCGGCWGLSRNIRYSHDYSNLLCTYTPSKEPFCTQALEARAKAQALAKAHTAAPGGAVAEVAGKFADEASGEALLDLTNQELKSDIGSAAAMLSFSSQTAAEPVQGTSPQLGFAPGTPATGQVLPVGVSPAVTLATDSLTAVSSTAPKRTKREAAHMQAGVRKLPC